MSILNSHCTLILTMAACDVKVGVQATNNRSYNVRGVKYWFHGKPAIRRKVRAPLEYKGDSVAFTDAGGALQVNGRNFGSVKTGDVVDLTSTGKVLINGTERSSQ